MPRFIITLTCDLNSVQTLYYSRKTLFFTFSYHKIFNIIWRFLVIIPLKHRICRRSEVAGQCHPGVLSWNGLFWMHLCFVGPTGRAKFSSKPRKSNVRAHTKPRARRKSSSSKYKIIKFIMKIIVRFCFWRSLPLIWCIFDIIRPILFPV